MINWISKRPKMAVYTMIAILGIAVVTGLCTMTGVKHHELEEWLKSVTAEDIFIQINYEYGSEASYYIPDDREEEELCRILTQIDKKNISKKASGGTVTPYQMMIRMPGDDGTLSREYLFHVEDNTSVSLTFDKDTADVLMKDGKYWHIKSSELVNFIKEKIEKKGHELMPAVEITRADIDHDGEEEIISVREYVSEVYRITVSEEDGTVISEMDASTGHHGWRNLFLCQNGEEEYLLLYDPTMGQGFATYGYQMYYFKDGEPVAVEEDRVSFEVDADTTLTPEVARFLEKVNGYLEKSTLLFCSNAMFTADTSDGLIIGPASAQDMMNHNQQLLDRTYNEVTARSEMNVAAAMRTVEAEDFVRLESVPDDQRELLAMAMNRAGSREITEAEAIAAGYNPEEHAYYWTGGIYLEKSSDIWLSNHDLHFEMECGLTENIVKVTYGKDDMYDAGYFQDEMLYRFIRGLRDRNDRIDEVEFQKYEPVLTEKMEETFLMMKSNPGNFFDYELCRFYEILEYEEEDGSMVHLYDFDFALLTGTPQHIGWAGGMYLDGNARLRGLNVGQFAVRLKDNSPQCYVFMLNDERYDPSYANYEDETFWQEKISERLNQEGRELAVS